MFNIDHRLITIKLDDRIENQFDRNLVLFEILDTKYGEIFLKFSTINDLRNFFNEVITFIEQNPERLKFLKEVLKFAKDYNASTTFNGISDVLFSEDNQINNIKMYTYYGYFYKLKEGIKDIWSKFFSDKFNVDYFDLGTIKEFSANLDPESFKEFLDSKVIGDNIDRFVFVVENFNGEELYKITVFANDIVQLKLEYIFRSVFGDHCTVTRRSIN